MTRTADYPEGASDALRAEIAEKLPKRLHGMDQAVMRGGMAGVYTMSADGHFILDRAPGVEGLYVALGCSGTGFKIAPAVGIGMAELITEGRASSVDLAPFRASRFAEGRPLRGEHEYHDRHYDQRPLHAAARLRERPCPCVPGRDVRSVHASRDGSGRSAHEQDDWTGSGGAPGRRDDDQGQRRAPRQHARPPRCPQSRDPGGPDPRR